MDYDKYYAKIEKDIIDEVPYNYTKHFLFDLPQVFASVVHFFLMFGIIYLIVTTTMTTTVERLPELCRIIGYEEIK